MRHLVAVLLACFVFAGAAQARQQSLTVDGYPIEIIYEPRNERVARRVQEICVDDLPRLVAEVGLFRTGPIRIDVVDDLRPYRHAFQGNLPVWGVAFALLRSQIIVVDAPRATRAFNSLEQVIPHELSHILLSQRVGPVGFPIWFVEGMAKWQAQEWTLVDSWQLMNAVWSKKAPRLWHLINEYPASEEAAQNAYRVSYAAFTALFDGRFDELPLFLDAAATTGSFPDAFQSYFGTSMETFMGGFQNTLEMRYHSRLLVFQTGPLFSIAAVIFLFVIARHQLRKRRKMRQMEQREAGLPADD